MTLRRFLALLAGVTLLSALVGATGKASTERAACDAVQAANDGYTYAGHQAVGTGHGVRATITQVRAPEVTAGHVAGWVGVGGPGQGPNGTDEWLQVGLATEADGTPFLYAEITRPGDKPVFQMLEQDVPVRASRRVAVLEMAGRPDWWRIWVDGDPVTNPIFLRGSSLRFAPIATAESWDGGQAACNEFSFRFERVSVSHGLGGSWHPFQPGYRFLDRGYAVRTLARTSAARERVARSLSDAGPAPYAFVASSTP